MKPALFEYQAPGTIPEALEALATDEMARPLAGGQSLIPMMNFRLATPPKLVDLGRIEALRGISVTDGIIRIGAMTRHRELEQHEAALRANPLIGEVMSNVAHAIIRNRGTIGGSIAHADAAAELPCLLVATGGSVVTEGQEGQRDIPAEDLFLFHMTTSIKSGELLTQVRIPSLPENTGYAFQEVARRHGDYALAGVCTLVTMERGVCTSARVAACGIGSKPLRMTEAEAELVGGGMETHRLEKAGEAARQYVTESNDLQASTEYRKDLVAALVRRTAALGARRAEEMT